MLLTQVSQLFIEKAEPLTKWLLKPAFFRPKNLSKIAIKIPLPINILLIEKIVNKLLSEQINEGEFNFLEDKTLQIDLLDAELKIGLSLKNHKMICTHFGSKAVASDVKLSINTCDAISLVKQEIDPDTLFFQRKLKIQGNTELAHHIKNTIDTLDPKSIPDFIFKLMTEYRAKILLNE